jgi:four helix bundle protein
MSRDHTKLRVFEMADKLAIRAYEVTAGMPPDERFGLRAQVRRAAVAVPANIVEGSNRKSRDEYCRFLEIARASSCECRYLLEFAHRVGHVSQDAVTLAAQYDQLSGSLWNTIKALKQLEE